MASNHAWPPTEGGKSNEYEAFLYEHVGHLLSPEEEVEAPSPKFKAVRGVHFRDVVAFNS